MQINLVLLFSALNDELAARFLQQQCPEWDLQFFSLEVEDVPALHVVEE